MAKGGKKDGTKSETTGKEGALQPGMKAFERGDYIRARTLLESRATDPELSTGAQHQARELIASTKLERGTLLTGLACVGLLLLVFLVTAFTQP